MNMFKKYLSIAGVTIGLLLFNACSIGDPGNDTSGLLGEWYKKSDFEGSSRSGTVLITIGGKAYMGTGYDGSKWLKDWWEYDPERDFWTRKTDFPGVARSTATAFSIHGKGYVGTGYDGTKNLRDFWEYDPGADSWKQIADFEGTARYGALSFAIGNRGYVGTGYDGSYLKDIWEYIPDTDSWTQRVSVGGSKRVNAFVFVIDDKAYLGGGKNSGVLQHDLWEYDAAADTWTAKKRLDHKDYTNQGYTISRELPASFVINGLGYITCGTVSALDPAVWEYNPAKDVWTKRTTFEGAVREGPVGFAMNGKGYLSTGRSGTLRYDDIWMFDPLATDTD